ncbi:uncharacterized protein EDB91DRAFT_1088738 [Suillus paluster]|uniref:uncharacterized protein n=1 Tax=Suillus paluster TaxID=48578 RepID=UPI001B880AA9|nr:uncharacterized protein EDB91DRAFT_1088738 [Suillus paluster]KAG1720687.1 hypothetical protein EDB91DRAFT_1088738 [Suillus paluster]
MSSKSSQRSLPLALSCLLQPHLFRRFLGLKALIPSRQHRPGHESISQERHNQGSSTRRDHSGSPIRPAITAPDQSTPEGKDRAGGVEEIGDDCFANAQLGISKLEKGKGKQREGSLPDAQNPLPNDSASPELNSKENDDLSLGKDPTSAKMAPAENCDTLPKVVGVTAARRFQKTKSSATTSDALPAATHASSSSQASLSSQAVQFSTSSYVMSGKAESSFQDARSSATKNVVIFGQSGVGKSSIINLLAGKKVAKTSADRKRCTLEYEGYDVTIENEPYRIYDTAGVDSDLMDPSGFLDAVTNAHKLMRELKEKGGPHLLLYCMKAGRIQGAFATNYRLFYEFLFEKKVPVALVITHLEREDPMDQWYTRNKTLLDHHAVKWIDQACITADANLDAKYVQKYTASREEVGDLIKRNVDKVENWNEGDGLLARVIGKSKDLSTGRPSKSDVLGVLTKRCGMEESLAKAVIQRLSS